MKFFAATILVIALLGCNAQEEEAKEVTSNVFALLDDSFDAFVQDHSIVLAAFSAEMCDDCDSLKEQWQAASLMLAEEDVALAEIQSEDSPALTSRFEINEFPSVKLFVDGEYYADYEGEFEAEMIAAFAEKMAAPAITELDNEEHLQEYISVEPTAVVLFGAADEEFVEMAEYLQDTHHFANIEAEMEDIEPGTIRVYRDYGSDFVDYTYMPASEEAKEDDDEEVKSESDLKFDALAEFILSEAKDEDESESEESATYEEESYEASSEGSVYEEEESESYEKEDEDEDEESAASGSYESEEESASGSYESEESEEGDYSEADYSEDYSEEGDYSEADYSEESASEAKEDEIEIEEQNEDEVEEQNEDEIEIEEQNDEMII